MIKHLAGTRTHELRINLLATGKWSYKGKHRGIYKPNFHWWHAKCYPNGVCHIRTYKVVLHPYIDAEGQGHATKTLSSSTTIKFTPQPY